MKNNSDLPSEFRVDNRTLTNPKEIANSFNVFFSTIGTNLSSNVNNINTYLKFNDYLNHPTDHRFKFQQVSSKEVLSIINEIKNNTSSGKDEISNILPKSIKVEISEPLTVIINQSLLTGTFPEKLKIAKINYDIFVSKIEYYGITGIPLALIKIYLINRFQYVQYKNMTSELLEIK